jgi:hypothetical protein
MDIFRHPANSRVFSIAGLILLSGFGMQSFFRSPDEKRLRNILFSFALVCGIAVLISLLTGNLQFPGRLSVAALKDFKDKASLSFYILACAVIQVFFLLIALLIMKKGKGWLYWLTLANFIVHGFLVIPFTMVSQVPVEEMNAFVKSFPSGFPISEAVKPLITEDLRKKNGLYGYPGFYSKQLTIQNVKVSPTINTAYKELWKEAAVMDSLAGQPVFSISNNGKIKLANFSPNRFELNYSSDTTSDVFIIQQYNHNWKAYVSGKETKIETHRAFMKLAVNKGSGRIQLGYRPAYILTAAIISLLTVIISIVLITVKRRTTGKT